MRPPAARLRRPGRTPRPTILYYNRPHSRVPVPIPDCPVEPTILWDRSRLRTADAVIFHIPTLGPIFRLRKRRGQAWVALSVESDANYPRLRDPQFMSRFDLTMTYRRDADLFTSYIWPGMADRLRAAPWSPVKSGFAVYMASSSFNLSGRNEYVRELMRFMPVDSYGRVLQNRQLTDDTGRETKLATISRYHFTLAFENSISTDYVTEKFFDPLLIGSVPVYLGAANVNEFAPGDHCYIDVADYSSPRDLAEYLLWVANHAEVYAEYLAWKERPLRSGFLEMADQQRVHPLCRLCLRLAGLSDPDP